MSIKKVDELKLPSGREALVRIARGAAPRALSRGGGSHETRPLLGILSQSSKVLTSFAARAESERGLEIISHTRSRMANSPQINANVRPARHTVTFSMWL